MTTSQEQEKEKKAVVEIRKYVSEQYDELKKWGNAKNFNEFGNSVERVYRVLETYTGEFEEFDKRKLQKLQFEKLEFFIFTEVCDNRAYCEKIQSLLDEFLKIL